MTTIKYPVTVYRKSIDFTASLLLENLIGELTDACNEANICESERIDASIEMGEFESLNLVIIGIREENDVERKKRLRRSKAVSNDTVKRTIKNLELMGYTVKKDK